MAGPPASIHFGEGGIAAPECLPDAAISAIPRPAIEERPAVGDLPGAEGERSAASIHGAFGKVLSTLTRFDCAL
jgi:hypothetical protein